MSVALAYTNASMPETYTVIIHPCIDTTGYWAECPMTNGGCTTQGETLLETQRNMFEAMALYLEDYPEITDYCLAFEVRHA